MKSITFKGKKVEVWQQNEREQFRSSNPLPIYSAKEIFLLRLKIEKILVCVAETGSGKSTQLPQYLAEMLEDKPGLIIVTQPRVLAAVSVAKRVGFEFDGPGIGDAGYSVGYKAGSKEVMHENTKIMFMTDGQFINEIVKRDFISQVKAIVIDEAHERSINTDIVLGMAKRLLEERRRENFYVVIASATIDPKPFLEFFNKTNNEVFKVPGRVFPVNLLHWPENNEEQKNIEIESVKGISEEFIVNKTLEALNKFSEGHTLVFLPRQKDIERCIERFSALAPGNLKALPLFGSLSVEEQMRVIEFDKNKNSKTDRLVAFCTNVAETSLTVQGVKLVIDTGLVNEARYDTQRRMNFLEMTWISRSSADQRMGRAGRLSEGVCVRLYSKDKLSRQSIEPEILRSSIDLTFLQLKVLKLDNLPLISRPDEKKIKNSYKNLKIAGALDNNYDVTSLGRLFSELPFDPLISSFISDLFFNHNLEIGLLIASLITAPGDIFYFGNKETRKEDLLNISAAAADFNSDIEFKINWYMKWLQQEDGRSFAADNKLNNRVFKYVKSTFDDNKDKFLKFKSSGNFSKAQEFYNKENSHENGEKEHECLSKALCNWLYEQSFMTIIPKMPQKGMRIITSNEKGVISTNSCIINKISTNERCMLYVSVSPFFRLSRVDKSDLIIAQNSHPIDMNHLEQCRNKKWLRKNRIDLNIGLVHNEKNVGPYLASSMDVATGKCPKNIEYLSEYVQDPYSKFISTVFLKNEASIDVFAPDLPQGLAKNENESNFMDSFDFVTQKSNAKRSAKKLFKSLKSKVACEESKEHIFICNGTFFVILRNGFLCSSIQSVNDNIRIVIPNLDYKDYLQFNKDFFPKFSVKTCDLADYNYNKKKKEAALLFKTEETASDYKNQFLKQNILMQSSQMVSNSDEDPALRIKFQCTTDLDINNHNLSRIMNVEIKKITSIQRAVACTIRITKLPNNFDITYLQYCKIPKPDNQPELLIEKSKISTGSATLYLNYSDEEEAKITQRILKKVLVAYPTTITGGKKVEITPDIKLITKVSLNWEIEFNSLEDAQHVYCQRNNLLESDYQIKANFFYSEFKKVPTNFYSEAFLVTLKKEIENISQEIKCQYNKTELGIRFKILNTPPKFLKQVKEKLKLKFDPVVLNMPSQHDPIRRFYFSRLFQNPEFLNDWPKMFDLGIQADENKARVKVYGGSINIGAFMKHLGDDFDDFSKRIHLFNLSSTVALLFERNLVGVSKLEKLKKKYEADSVFFGYEKSNVILYVEKSSKFAANIQPLERKFERLLKKLQNDSDAFVESQCVFCGENDNLKIFSLCGHKYCTGCISFFAIQTKAFPIQCPKCFTNIKVEDLSSSISKKEKEQLVQNAIEFYLQTNSISLRFCPLECKGLVDTSKGFSVCQTCKKEVCGKCGSSNILHAKRTCEQLSKVIENAEMNKKLLNKLFEKAHEFVKGNWRSDQGLNPIQFIKRNENLMNELSSIRKLFDAGCKQLQINDILENGFFGFHGSCEEAIKPICEEGFDPNRRSGQVHGPGEYFGVNADVSHAYCKQGNLMIISFILKGPFVKTVENFCYVVNNPNDQKITYSIPVLVVNFKIKTEIDFGLSKKNP